MSTPPTSPKIYHIVHVDRLPSIIAEGFLCSDSIIQARQSSGTIIGMDHIKQRRLANTLISCPTLHVGDCVPFYFCPRSVMLYIISKGNNPDLAYSGGQGPIVHLEADLCQTVAWAQQQSLQWAFTLSNAGAYYFEDRNDLSQLDQIDWGAVQAQIWQGCKEGKQAEFLIENRFPWHLVERIGVHSSTVRDTVGQALQNTPHKPLVQIIPAWYY